jgi:hypothetical protein
MISPPSPFSGSVVDMYLLWEEGVGVTPPPSDRHQNAMGKTARKVKAARQHEKDRKEAERRRAEAEAGEAQIREARSMIYLTQVEFVERMTKVQPSEMVPGPKGYIPKFMSESEAEEAFKKAKKWSMDKLLSRPSKEDRVQVQLPQPGGMTDAITAMNEVSG